MTNRPVSWQAVFNFLEDLADGKPTAADYAMTVRILHDVLVEATSDPEGVRQFLLFRMFAQQHRGAISQQHRNLVVERLPKPPRQKRGRPKGALGDNAYNKRYQLYLDWIYEKSLNPRLTKEQFARQRLRVTDKDLTGNYAGKHRARMDALLQELKPARMKLLDEGQRRALETIYPLVVTYDQYLARQWREAKQHCPALTKEDFLQEFFGWPRDRIRHPIEAEMIGDYLAKLEQGEKALADSERG